MVTIRSDKDFPKAVNEWGWKYHHIGIPTKEIKADEKYIPKLKMYVSGFSKCPFGIEWMRFEPDSPIPKIIQQQPHIAFAVDDLNYELTERKLKILTEANSPSDGISVAMVLHNNAPVELMEFE